MKNNIRKLRLSRNLTEKELGELIGKSQQSVSRLENGNRTISIHELHILADYFNVSTDYILARTNITNPTNHRDMLKKFIAENADVLKQLDDLDPDEIKFIESIKNKCMN